jgi:ferric-dicitrate binding protein FerR (iron transport regulator)
MVAGGAMSALAAAAVIAVVVSLPSSLSPSVVVATVDRAEGTTERQPGTPVRSGDWIVTGQSMRLALRTATGASIRLDEHSRARLLSDRSIEMTAGAVYVDTADGAPALEIQTPLGAITDIGTQFEVRFIGDVLRVRVRSGVVAVQREGPSIRVEPNTEVALTSRGVESRAASGFGDDWNWTTAVAPVFHVEGQRLGTFLEHLARENGWTLRYEDEALKRAAADVVLHGSIDGLDTQAALAVTLTVADLSHSLERGELRIWRSSAR